MAGFVPDLATGIAGAFNFGASGSQLDDAPRVPMTFTSRLRLIAAVASGALGTASDDILQASINSELLIAQFPFLAGPAFKPTIAMAINPKSVKFSQPKRYTKKDTREGSVFFHFTNTRGQNNDVLTMSFTGNTGNIDLRGSLGSSGPVSTQSGETSDAANVNRTGSDTGALAKLIAWHNLYLLTREPMVLADGTKNEFLISYTSALMPMQVTFYGFFSKVLEFEENASKPNSREYNFEFVVNKTQPDLDSLMQILGDLLTTPSGSVEVQAVQQGDIDASGADGSAFSGIA